MKTYNATIGNESNTFKAENLKEAKKLAQLYKRMNKLTGKVEVKLSK